MTTDPTTLTGTPDGVREAWAIVEAAWVELVEQARELPEPELHEPVDGEWSFVETLRHLVYVSDAWVGRIVVGLQQPYHRLGLPPDHGVGRPEPGVDVRPLGIDVMAPASLDEALAARAERQATVRGVVTALDDVALARVCDQATAPGHPP